MTTMSSPVGATETAVAPGAFEVLDACHRQNDNGRQLSAWMGLVPRQDSSGGKPKLPSISKAATCTCEPC